MKPLALTLAATLLSASAVSAAGIETVDSNGDRFASFSEIAAVYPTMTRSDFRVLDTNDDRRVSAVEFSASGAQAVLNKHVTRATVAGVGSLDLNGDGFASRAELSSAYPGFNSFDFDDLDENNDGRISRTEIYSPDAQAVISRYEAGSQILVSLDSVDTNRSGFAELAELQAEYPNLSRIDFQRFDANDDNRISWDELYELNTITVLGKNR